VVAISSGVDTDYFSPDRPYESPYASGAAILVFTGAMDYWANVDAVRWFATAIFPAVRSQLPGAMFYIVGARPGAEVTELARQEGVVVTGTVADVRPYLAHAAVAVAPMRIARGVQNKVLEAMAMGCPVLASPPALEGIDAEPGRDLVVADGADAMSRNAAEMLKDCQPDLRKSARACVLRRYQWADHLHRFAALLDGGRAQAAQPISNPAVRASAS
jgi:sugar transferase (PEP-CTERM/EpsH1 system associated)